MKKLNKLIFFFGLLIIVGLLFIIVVKCVEGNNSYDFKNDSL